jgi:hypothetical protein
VATITIDDLVDALNATTEDFGRGAIADATADLQHYPLFSAVDDGVARGNETSGTSFKWSVAYKKGTTTSSTGFYEELVFNPGEGTVTGEVDFHRYTTTVVYDQWESDINQDPNKVFDLVRQREHRELVGFAQSFDRDMILSPVSSSDTFAPYGLCGYWLDHDTGDGGFNGKNHTNFSGGPGGIDTSLEKYKNYRHWSGKYTDVTATDLIAKVRKAYMFTHFVPPVVRRVPTYSGRRNQELLVPLVVADEMKDVLTSQNENLGADFDPYPNGYFNGVPIVSCPVLDYLSSSLPVIGVDWSGVKFYPCPNAWMNDSGWFKDNNNPMVMKKVYTTAGQIVVQDRRQHVFMLAKSDPADELASAAAQL